MTTEYALKVYVNSDEPEHVKHGIWTYDLIHTPTGVSLNRGLAPDEDTAKRRGEMVVVYANANGHADFAA